MIKFQHFNDPYCTHQPVLYEVLRASSGKVLELGCGKGSTAITHYFAKDREIITLEDDPDWYKIVKEKFEGDNHKFVLIDNWSEALREYLDEYSVVFVDQSGWFNRLDTVKLYKEHADYVVVHDYDSLPWFLNYNWQDDYRFYQEFTPYPRPYKTGPPTAVLSNRYKFMFLIDFANYISLSEPNDNIR